MKKATTTKSARTQIQVYQDGENQGVAKKPRILRTTVKRQILGDLNGTRVESLLQKKDDKETCLRPQKKPALKKATQPIKNTRKKIRVVWDCSGDVHKYLISIENKFLIKKDYMNGWTFTKNCRSILVDWMIGIHAAFDLDSDTLYKAVYILDRYMEADSGRVTKENAQLVAGSCLIIASKFEETMPIDHSNLVPMCNPVITYNDLFTKEIEILVSLEFRLNVPLPIDFLRRFASIAGMNTTEWNIVKYFTESSLLSYELVGERPSILAAACMFLALSVSRLDHRTEPTRVWTPSLTAASAISYKDFSHTLEHVAKSVKRSSSSLLQSVQAKYSRTRYSKVSRLPICQPSNDVLKSFIPES